jgi:Ca-activated chloride channel family protein
MQHKLESIEKVFAKSVNFKFQCDEWVQPRYIFRLNPEISPLPLISPLSFGNLQFGRSISILFEFLVRKLPTGMTRLNLASGKLEMEIPKQGSVLQYLEFRRKVMPDPEPELPPAAILEAMSRLTLYRLQEKASVEVSQGEVSRASKHLQYLATHLLSNGKRELAHTVLVEAEHIRQSQRFSADGEKQIKYGTRALLLPPPGQEFK